MERPIVRLVFYASLALIHAVRRTIPWLRGPDVCFYPQRPNACYTAWPVCQLLGLRHVTDPSKADFVCLFDDRDKADPAELAGPAREIELAHGKRDQPIVNINCMDVRKRTVGDAFEEVFGYPLAVDPIIYRGPAVEKSDANAQHDGRLVDCPLPAAKPGCAYQVFVDTRIDGNLVQNIRTPVIGRSIPFVYVKHRSFDERFTEELARPATIGETDDHFSAAEQELILRLFERLSLAFGEADVVRDRTTQRIYVVDVNKTAYGPPRRIGLLDRYRATARLARSFSTEFLRKPSS